MTRNGGVLVIGYGTGTAFPQYAALHLTSGYFRMTYGSGGTWGTSVVLLPSFWEGGRLYQGAPVDATWSSRSGELLLSIQGTLSGLASRIEVRLPPPSGDSLTGFVRGETSGRIELDSRPGEAFKLVMLSSMRIGDDQWDARAGYVGDQAVLLPASGWILDPPVAGSRFGLRGGTSGWKPNAPTIEIRLDQPHLVTGWVTPSTDPNDDNVGFWAAADHVVPSWRYTILARRADSAR